MASSAVLASVIRLVNTALCIQLTSTVTVWFLTRSNPEGPSFLRTNLLDGSPVTVLVLFCQVGRIDYINPVPEFEFWEVCRLFAKVSFVRLTIFLQSVMGHFFQYIEGIQGYKLCLRQWQNTALLWSSIFLYYKNLWMLLT